MPSYAITGASRGLGLELVKQLSATPTNIVFAIVRNPTTAVDLKNLASARPGIHMLKADVTEPETLKAAAVFASAVTGGTLDVLIHNAFDINKTSMALSPSQLPFDHDALWEVCRPAFATGLFGGIWSTNAFLPLIKKGAERKVIHISTGVADLDFIKVTEDSQATTYGMAKAAMNLVTAKYAAEFASEGIKFLALSPGWVNTAEGPVPPEMMPFIETMMANFKKAEPNLQGPISKEDSVRMQLELIDRLDEKLSGQFVSHHGNKYWF